MELAWFVGVDWGSQTHQACVSDVAGKLLGERAFEHSGQGLSEMADWLLSFTAGKAEQVGVAIETPRGPVVESLMERGFAVHAINPKQLDRFRDRISPAGAKDDRRDARVLASALRTDPHCLRRLEPTDPVIVELREWSRLSEEITRERVRQANRMREQLWRYYPQLLAATSDDVAAPWALALWRRLPTPVAAQRVREATLTKLLKQHRIRRVDAATLCDRLRAPAVRVAPGAAEAAAAHVRLIAERLVLVNRQLAHARSQLDRLVHQLAEAAPAEDPDAPAESEPEPSPPPPDAAILLSLPGIGTGVLACLLAEGSDALRRRDLRRASLSLRSGAGHPAFGQEPARGAPPGCPRPAARRRLPLGSRRCPPRPGQPRQVSGAAQPRPWTRPLAALSGRPPAQRRLRHAPRRHLLRPAPCRKCHRVNS